MQAVFGKYLSIKQLSLYLSIPEDTLYKIWPTFTNDFNVRTYKEGKRILFNREDIDSMMERKKIGGGR